MTADGRPVGLIETMRAKRGEVALLDLHLARLAGAAEAFGYPLALADARRQIGEATCLVAPSPLALRGGAAGAGRRQGDVRATASRLRLVLWPDGTLDLSLAPLPAEPFRTAAVYPLPLAEAGTWRCARKTTARAHYDRALAWAVAQGVDEPILFNPRGEITEGARTNVFVRDGDRLVTPPLASGGLAGVFRQSLVDAGADERALTPDDLARADEVLLVNALRGAMPVELIRIE